MSVRLSQLNIALQGESNIPIFRFLSLGALVNCVRDAPEVVIGAFGSLLTWARADGKGASSFSCNRALILRLGLWADDIGNGCKGWRATSIVIWAFLLEEDVNVSR